VAFLVAFPISALQHADARQANCQLPLVRRTAFRLQRLLLFGIPSRHTLLSVNIEPGRRALPYSARRRRGGAFARGEAGHSARSPIHYMPLTILAGRAPLPSMGRFCTFAAMTPQTLLTWHRLARCCALHLRSADKTPHHINGVYRMRFCVVAPAHLLVALVAGLDGRHLSADHRHTPCRNRHQRRGLETRGDTSRLWQQAYIPLVAQQRRQTFTFAYAPRIGSGLYSNTVGRRNAGMVIWAHPQFATA